jgi:integrase
VHLIDEKNEFSQQSAPENMLPRYTIPTIYTAKGNVNERWHVEFYYTLQSGEKKRYRIRGNVNRIPDPKKRLEALLEIQKQYTEKLQNGWTPVSKEIDESALHRVTISYCIEKIIRYKEAYSTKSYHNMYKSHLKMFNEWLFTNQKHRLHPAQINRNDIVEFLTYLSVDRKVSNRTRNNYLIDIRNAFDEMYKYDPSWIQINPCGHIDLVRVRSTVHEPYEKYALKELFKYLKTYDQNLYRFCKLFMYLGIRPAEAVKMKVGDINLDAGTFYIPAANEKTGTRKLKPIVDFMVFELEYLRNYPMHYYIFTTSGKPGEVSTNRDYYTRQFQEVKKQLKIPPQFTMYSLKHTFIVELDKQGIPHREIMKITGHKTLQALQAYLQKYFDKDSFKLTFKFKDITILDDAYDEEDYS